MNTHTLPPLAYTKGLVLTEQVKTMIEPEGGDISCAFKIFVSERTKKLCDKIMEEITSRAILERLLETSMEIHAYLSKEREFKFLVKEFYEKVEEEILPIIDPLYYEQEYKNLVRGMVFYEVNQILYGGSYTSF